jgi:hypothetical protein
MDKCLRGKMTLGIGVKKRVIGAGRGHLKIKNTFTLNMYLFTATHAISPKIRRSALWL